MIKLTINDVDYTPNLVLPFKWSKLLDERLDETRLSLREMPIDKFIPGLPVTITDGNKSFYYILTNDESDEIPPGSGTYNHELMLIEETKTLEGIPIDTLTFQNSLGRTYTSNPQPVEPVYE